MTFPRLIWTPDIVPAASVYDIDCYFDSYALLVQAAMVTEKIKLGIVATDCLRRAPTCSHSRSSPWTTSRKAAPSSLWVPAR